MSWPLRLIDMPTSADKHGGYELEIGDCFFYQDPGDEYDWADDPRNLSWFRFFCKGNKLSDYYRQHNSHRLPLLVYLPGPSLFCVDGACWRSVPDPAGSGTICEYYGGWTVKGEAPLLEVSPSINCVGIYHGFIQSGVISDDCEGRQYDQQGRIR